MSVSIRMQALASAGTLSKAVAKGLANPAFRVVQNHFAATNNIGAVAAKEQVWEVRYYSPRPFSDTPVLFWS